MRLSRDCECGMRFGVCVYVVGFGYRGLVLGISVSYVLKAKVYIVLMLLKNNIKFLL